MLSYKYYSIVKMILSWFMRFFNLFDHLILSDFTKVTCLFSIPILILKDFFDLKPQNNYLKGKKLILSYHLQQTTSGPTIWKISWTKEKLSLIVPLEWSQFNLAPYLVENAAPLIAKASNQKMILWLLKGWIEINFV